MSSEYVTLSFFKSNHIHYHYDKPFILFPCPHCALEAKMNAQVGVWECSSCGRHGTLITLMEMVEENGIENRVLQHLKVYHPKEEYHLIKCSFESLIQTYGERVQKLYRRVEKLIEYYQEERERRP